MAHDNDIRDLIDRVRARWRAVRAGRAARRGALAAAAVLAIALALSRWTAGAPLALALLAAAAAAAALAAMVWALLPLRRVPPDRQVARYIEERVPELDDRLVTAVDVGAAPARTRLAEPVIADAARRIRGLDVDQIVPVRAVRRSLTQGGAAVLGLAAVAFVARGPAREALDAASLTLFPARVALQVTPGDARIKAGTSLAIEARLVGNRAPVVAQVQIADGERWRGVDMATSPAGAFRLAIPSVADPFKYRVAAGSVMSRTYAVSVVHPPRVSRIDVDYTYPAGLQLPPRTERDSGDIYAPAGTAVRVHVFTDPPAATGRLSLGGGQSVALTPGGASELSGSLTVVADDSYRVALADREGMANAGDTEYFIRTLQDRPPEVRVVAPAADRSVTQLEEVEIEAQAEDDYGVDRLDLVYSVGGGPEKVVPFTIPRRSPLVRGRRTLYLENLDVHPGDFVSYYVRARDITHGTRPNEARSDIFFLEVKPYEQEFALAQSQAQGGGGGRGSVDDLVAAQKEVIVSTFKLDRRSQAANGAKSESDIRAVSKAESELKTRVEETSSTFRESTMRDPRRRPQRGRGRAPAPPVPSGPKAGQTLVEEDDMTAAATAMAHAIASLDALKTGPAIPPEMDALSHLLKAQADVKRRELMRQQAGAGAGNNNRNVDLSTLFDKELRKQSQTNYETRSSAERRDDSSQSALDKIRDLAQRQDELLKKQQELAQKRGDMSEAELKRALESLTREQSELRQKAEELARQMGGQQSSPSGQPAQEQDARQGARGQSGQQSGAGQQGGAGQSGQSGRQGQSGQQGQGGQQGQTGQNASSQGGGSAGGDSQDLRDASEAMRTAASDLRRQDPSQASASGRRALEKLRQLEQQLQAAAPDERRRRLGEMQLEARQLADAQRQLAAEQAKAGQRGDANDAARRLAAEQERLADRARQLQQTLKSQSAAAASGADSKDRETAARMQAAAAQASQEIERQEIPARMQKAAEAMRQQAGAGRGVAASPDEQAVASALDRIADRLGQATGAQDGESRELADAIGRVQELRDQLADLGRQMQALGRGGEQSGGRGGSSGRGSQGSPGRDGRAGAGRQGAGAGGNLADLARLQDEYRKRLQEASRLVGEMQRQDGRGETEGRGGAGFTFEGQGMTLSAPGTEAFKQDFSNWESLRRQATEALDRVESALSKKLQAKESKDRLAAGVDDKAPPEYTRQVDSYFKAIAKKKP